MWGRHRRRRRRRHLAVRARSTRRDAQVLRQTSRARCYRRRVFSQTPSHQGLNRLHERHGRVEKCIGRYSITRLCRRATGCEHLKSCLREHLADLLGSLRCLINRILGLDDCRFGAKYLSGCCIHGLARVPVRTENPFGGSLCETTGLAFPVRQLHSLVSMMRDHLAVEAIPHGHESYGDIVKRILINVRKRGPLYRLRPVVTWMKTFNRHDSSPFGSAQSAVTKYARHQIGSSGACKYVVHRYSRYGGPSATGVLACARHDARRPLPGRIDILIARSVCRNRFNIGASVLHAQQDEVLN